MGAGVTTVARGGAVAVTAGAAAEARAARWCVALWCAGLASAKLPPIAIMATAASKRPRINSLRLKS
jgi:hypothetical protein